MPAATPAQKSARMVPLRRKAYVEQLAAAVKKKRDEEVEREREMERAARLGPEGSSAQA